METLSRCRVRRLRVRVSRRCEHARREEGKAEREKYLSAREHRRDSTRARAHARERKSDDEIPPRRGRRKSGAQGDEKNEAENKLDGVERGVVF